MKITANQAFELVRRSTAVIISGQIVRPEFVGESVGRRSFFLRWQGERCVYNTGFYERDNLEPILVGSSEIILVNSWMQKDSLILLEPMQNTQQYLKIIQ